MNSEAIAPAPLRFFTTISVPGLHAEITNCIRSTMAQEERRKTVARGMKSFVEGGIIVSM